MKLVIDYRLAAYSYRGMARYGKEMTTELLKILPSDWKIILYVDSKSTLHQYPSNCKIRVLPTKNYIVGEQLLIPYYLQKDKADILWSPANTFPLFPLGKVKIVATIHDLIFMAKPQEKQNIVQIVGRIYRRIVIKTGIKNLAACCTVSDFTKRELEQRFKLKNIILTYNCINKFAQFAEFQKKKKSYVRGDRFFTLSGDAPSKNLKLLLDWFSLHPNYTLDVAGVSRNSVLRKIAPKNVCILPPNLPEDKIVEFYYTCKAFLFVSKQEGFGIPLLEAMTCGCKLIVSNRTSMPEIAGKNALYVNPESINELTDAINGIDNFNLDMDKMHMQLAKYYNWMDSANNLYLLLKTL